MVSWDTFFEDECELDEAEEMVQKGETFPGNQPYLIHCPDGIVYTPFEKGENVYYDRPVWNKAIYF